MEFLTFKLAEDEYAVAVAKTREVLDVSTVTKVPQTPDYVVGVINLRGRVVPIVDLRQKLGLPASDYTVDTCIIIMEMDLDGEVTVVGALADAVCEVMELMPEQIEPPPKIGSRLKVEFIQGMGKRDEQFIILLNIEKIFTSDELAFLQSAGEETQSLQGE